MKARHFNEFENEVEEFSVPQTASPEINPSTKLARRRKIEDLFEEKRLREELDYLLSENS